uniref:Actinodin2 n=1 Tax=Electrophorus electricus TaxID=8005 RepID=A0A4W4DP36_ELEEL
MIHLISEMNFCFLMGTVADASVEKQGSSSGLPKLGRERRSIAYKQQPDFGDWYKYFMATHNQEGIENLDRIYMLYLQNKHRVEEGRSYNHYLNHLSEIYKACANSDDPDCIAESTSKPAAKVLTPAPFRQAIVKGCNPYLDPYCVYTMDPRSAAPEESAPAPVKASAPAPLLTALLPLHLRAPLGYNHAPVMESFLSAEQRAELLRICSPFDVECLQYHLRAAYGYKPSLSPAPSYAHLGCDPAKDPYCRPMLVARAPSGLYQLYPSCDPALDPLCAIHGAPAAQVAGQAEEAPREQFCNPLFDRGCNPLTATKLARLTNPVLEYTPQDEPAPVNLACDPRYSPYCLMGGTAALMRPPPLLPQFQTHSSLGIPAASSTARDGIIEPHPDCDPEIDFNCRLRRAEPAADEGRAEVQRDEPTQQESGQGNPSTANIAPEHPRFENFLRAYMGPYKK